MAPIQTGIFTGINSGIGSGLDWWPYNTGTSLLANLDFSAPTTSWKTGRTGFSSAYATDEWLLQNYSGGYANNVGSETLVDSNGITGQTCVGIWDGTSYTSRKAWETTSALSGLDCDGFTALDCDDEDLCVRLVFRWANTTTGIRWLVSKFASTAGASAGWGAYTGSSGNVTVVIHDGTNTISKTLTADHTDGGLHYLELFYDKSANLLHAKSDLVATSSDDASSVTDSLTNSEAFYVGDPLSGLTNGIWQATYVGGCVGANAQSMYDEEFWNHASDPTGLLTTQTRASLISVPVADGYVGHFAADTLPIGYHSAFTGSSKLGLYCNRAVTNIIPYSEALSNWSGSTTTKTDNEADSPDGFRSASKLLATSADGLAVQAVTAVAETTYTWSVWVKRADTGPASGVLRLYDADNSAIIADVPYTATGNWQLVSVTGETGAANTDLRAQIIITADTEAIYAWGAQVNLGSARGAYIRTNGAAASLAASDYRVEELVPMAAARVEADFVSALFSNNAGNHSVFTATAGSTNGWRLFYVDSADFLMQARDEDGNIWSSGAAGSPAIDTLYNYVARWDIDSGGFPENPDMTLSFHVDGTKIGVPEQDQTTVTDALAYLYVGHSPSTGTELDGYIQSIRVYNEVGEEPTV